MPDPVTAGAVGELRNPVAGNILDPRRLVETGPDDVAPDGGGGGRVRRFVLYQRVMRGNNTIMRA